MEKFILYAIFAIAVAIPVWLLKLSNTFLWRVTNRFSGNAIASKLIRGLALLTMIVAISYTLYGIYAIYEPWFTKTHKDTHGIIMLLGPALYGLYSAGLSMSVAVVMFVVSKNKRFSDADSGDG